MGKTSLSVIRTDIEANCSSETCAMYALRDTFQVTICARWHVDELLRSFTDPALHAEARAMTTTPTTPTPPWQQRWCCVSLSGTAWQHASTTASIETGVAILGHTDTLQSFGVCQDASRFPVAGIRAGTASLGAVGAAASATSTTSSSLGQQQQNHACAIVHAQR